MVPIILFLRFPLFRLFCSSSSISHTSSSSSDIPTILISVIPSSRSSANSLRSRWFDFKVIRAIDRSIIDWSDHWLCTRKGRSGSGRTRARERGPGDCPWRWGEGREERRDGAVPASGTGAGEEEVGTDEKQYLDEGQSQNCLSLIVSGLEFRFDFR